ncbi:uncharacterized protein LOC143249924 isoform X1 [Tachypleus tridentatus]|uniref:uncharacterized protein LOC143249924 isoform X1 n=1 Tax=Tachypleus tridentatus TaxID=6853 RepID=UPI003FD10465
MTVVGREYLAHCAALCLASDKNSINRASCAVQQMAYEYVGDTNDWWTSLDFDQCLSTIMGAGMLTSIVPPSSISYKRVLKIDRCKKISGFEGIKRQERFLW